MNKKEVAEIKRLFHPDRCPITRICGCYVDGEKNKKTKMKDAFLSLPEEEMFKYFEILKKTLSGTIGRNLLDMEFPLVQEAGGGAQEYLMKLRNSQLKDDELLDEFYDKVIETFMYPENYYIILIHGAYDIPKKASDGIEMFDASDDVYNFILCSICPVKLTKPGLCYNEDTNSIEQRIRDWFVEMPVTGFLFPAFTDLFEVIFTLFTAPFIEVIFQDAVFLLPSCAIAIIVTFFPPVFFFNVTTPFWFTVATFILLDFHTTFLFDALLGITETFNVIFLPAAIFLEIPDKRSDETFILDLLSLSNLFLP